MALYSIVNTKTDSITVTTAKSSHIYAEVDKLEGVEKVGSKQCVELIKHYANAQSTANWAKGTDVIGNADIQKGTAIATFKDGIYKSYSTGNHAAFYISQDSNGITVMDQWKDDVKKPKVSSRYISKKGKDATGNFINPSNNADAYSIILW